MTKRRVIAATAIAIGCGAAAVVAAPTAHSIIGGSTAAGSYPWAAVVLYPDGNQYCSGSLISSQWIATAGHCVDSLKPGYKIRVGSKDYQTGGTLVSIVDTARGVADIGLMKLSQPVPYTPVKIATSSPAPGAAVKLMGWGVTSETGDSPRLLKELNTTVLADSNCKSEYIKGAREICVKVNTTGTACYGDSGGPALVDGMLVGADSRGGQKCGDSGREVYGDLVSVRGWINRIIGAA